MPLLAPRIQDDGVVLGAWELRDAPCVQDASSDPAITSVTTVPTTSGRAEAEAFVRRQWQRLEDGTGWSLAVADPATDECVGQVGLWLRDLDRGRAQLGYWIRPGARGRGLAARALAAMSAFAGSVPGLERLEVVVEPGNGASLATAARADYVREGVLARYERIAGVPTDLVMHAHLVHPAR